MRKAMRPKARGIAWMLMLVYFASYMTRINFTVMLVKVCADMRVDKIDLAAVVTALTITYGAGQLVSGFIGDRIKPKYLLTFGLLLAVLCNIVMACSRSIPFMTGVWCVNGFAHALLWPPMVRLMSIYLTDEEYSYACVRVAWGSSLATILLYLGCPLLLGWGMSWRSIMLLCAALVLGIAAAWAISTRKLLSEPLVKLVKPTEAQGARMRVPRYVVTPVVLIMLAILMQGVLRDGVTNWMPSYLLETFGLKEEQAIVVTVVQAVFSMASFYVFDVMHRKWFKNEVTCAGVIFGMSAACALAMVLLGGGSVAISAVLMALIVACMHGVNLMLVTVVPKRFVATGNVSFYSGLMNSCTYAGAALSTYGFAALADGMGWGATILSWVAFGALGVALSLAAVPLWKRFVS